MKTEEFDKLFRNKIGSMEGVPPGSDWSKEKTWEKLQAKTSGKGSRSFLKYAAASVTIFLFKTQKIFAGASVAAKTTFVVVAAATVTTSVVYVSGGFNKNEKSETTANIAAADNITKNDIIEKEIIPEEKEIIVSDSETVEAEKPVEIVEKKTNNSNTIKETPKEVVVEDNQIAVHEDIIIDEPVAVEEPDHTTKTSATNTSTKKAKIDIEDILFKKNSVEVVSSSMSELNYLLEIMRRNPQLKLLVVGYTDEKEKDVEKLSSDRGYIIYKYLTSQGVENSRISYKGYGTRKKYSSKSEEGRQLNRRAEIIISE